jgi:hypothetical protein
MKLKHIQNAYKEIFYVLEENKDAHAFNIAALKHTAEVHMYGVKIKEEWGFDIDPKSVQTTGYMTFGEYMSLGHYGKNNQRSISWSDDGRQPEDETLLAIRFSTGAYIFGEDYPESLFNDLFIELKSFAPKYSDSHNHCLYFSIENAKFVFNQFNSILAKYNQLNKEDYKKRRAEKLRKELEQLEK